jgi:dTMP kinase
LWATEGLLPDLTVLLDLDENVARQRLSADNKPFDRLENEKQDFHARVRHGFLELARAEPERFLVVDATLPADVIAAQVHERAAAI